MTPSALPRGPRFLDEVAPAPALPDPAPAASSPTPDFPRGPMLLDAAAGGPARLDLGWSPELVEPPRVRAGAATWLAGGLGLLLVGWLVLSVVSFVVGLFGQGLALGLAGVALLGIAGAMVGCAALLEWRAWRSLGSVGRLRAMLAAPDAPLAAVRAQALSWLRQVGDGVPDALAVARLLRNAETAAEVRGILRNRMADPLRERAAALGRRVAAEGATLVAICPHAAWDGVVAGGRGLLVVRRVAALYGLRPGVAVTVALLRRVAWTAAGTAGLTLVSQGLADHVLSDMPVVRHVAAAMPGTGAAAVRLYRLAGVTAEACCPVTG